MSVQTAVCDAFVSDAIEAMLQAEYRVALIRADARGSYGKQTQAYGELGSDEVSGAGYVAGGARLVGARIALRDGSVCLDFDPVSWAGADIYASGALIYSPSRQGRAACVMDFGGVYAALGGETFHLPIDCPIRF